MSGKEGSPNGFFGPRASQVAHQLSTTLVTKFKTNSGVTLKPPNHAAADRFSMWELQETDTCKSISTQFTRRLVLMNGPDYAGSGRGRFGREAGASPEPSKKNCLQIEVTKADFEFWTAWQLFCARRVTGDEAAARRFSIPSHELREFAERAACNPADQPGETSSPLLHCPLSLTRWRDGRGPRYAIRLRYYRNQVSDGFLSFRRGDRVDLKILLSGLYMIGGRLFTAFKFLAAQRHTAPLAADRVAALWTYEDAIREFPPPIPEFAPRPEAAAAVDPFKTRAAAVPTRNMPSEKGAAAGVECLKPDVTAAECCVCIDAPAEVVVHPCKHVNYCLQCIDDCIKAKNTECAFCRRVISSYTMLEDTPASEKETLFYA